MQIIDPLEIVPLTSAPRLTLPVPGSKSITNRALVLAALATRHGESVIENALHAEDTDVMIQALRTLGFSVVPDWSARPPTIRVSLSAGATNLASGKDTNWVPRAGADLFLANSGTSMRFLTALVSLGHGWFRLDGTPRMRERPMADLIDALNALGASVETEFGNHCPPVIVEARGLRGGRAEIRGTVSSQFLSALFMVCPLARTDVTIAINGPQVSAPYVNMTRSLVRDFGGTIEHDALACFRIPGRQHYRPRHFRVEPDASAASYFFAAAAVSRGEITVPGLCRSSIQGDVRFLDILEQMGCEVRESPLGLTVQGGPLRGADVDMADQSDCVMTLAAVACVAAGPTTIRNVGHIRHKETDRLQALTIELTRVGAGVEELGEGLRIVPGALRAATIETYNDHRMAMSFAILGLVQPGIRIRNPGCVAKTYPAFFEDLARLYDG